MKELIIVDEVLVRCETDEKAVTIPPKVNYVFVNAFNTCPDIEIINLNRAYVVKELTYYLTRLMKDVVDGWDNDNYAPCFPVYDIDEPLIEKSIENTKANIAGRHATLSLNVVTLTADKLALIQQSKEKGYDVPSLYNLPVDEKDNEYGILYIKGISKENIDLLGGNFAYNLFRSHSLMGYTLSENWLVVLSTDARLDSADSVSAFSKQSCWMNSPKAYLKYMAELDKVLPVEPGCFDDVE